MLSLPLDSMFWVSWLPQTHSCMKKIDFLPDSSCSTTRGTNYGVNDRKCRIWVSSSNQIVQSSSFHLMMWSESSSCSWMRYNMLNSKKTRRVLLFSYKNNIEMAPIETLPVCWAYSHPDLRTISELCVVCDRGMQQIFVILAQSWRCRGRLFKTKSIILCSQVLRTIAGHRLRFELPLNNRS